MTYERKITAGLEDIKAIIFECKKCKSRLSMSPDSVGDIPINCLRLECKQPWKLTENAFSESVRSPFANFVDGLAKIRKTLVNNPDASGFTIILEFDETEMMKK